jgi:hypothetical protein
MPPIVLKLVGSPSIIAASDGNGGGTITMRARNHPADGVRLHFESVPLVQFLRAFAERLRLAGKSEIFPGTVQLIIESKDRHAGLLDVAGNNRLIMFRLVGWKDPNKTRNAGDPPTLVFDQASAQRLFTHICQTTGKIF